MIILFTAILAMVGATIIYDWLEKQLDGKLWRFSWSNASIKLKFSRMLMDFLFSYGVVMGIAYIAAFLTFQAAIVIFHLHLLFSSLPEMIVILTICIGGIAFFWDFAAFF